MRRYKSLGTWMRIGAGLLAGLSGGFLLGRWFTLSRLSRAVDWPTTASSIANIAQVIGLIVGGTWAYRLFIRQRTVQPSLEIAHDFQSFLLEPDPIRTLIRVTVTIRNVSKILMSPRHGQLLLDFAGPTHDDTVQWIDSNRREFDFGDYDLLLEPGESHRYVFDFVVARAAGLVRLRTVIRQSQDSSDFWDSNSVYPLAPPDVRGRPITQPVPVPITSGTTAGAEQIRSAAPREAV